MAAVRGILRDYNFNSEKSVPLYAFLRQLLVNEFPVLLRLPRIPAVAENFTQITYVPRPRAYTLGAAIADTVATSVTLSDASYILIGDVLKLNSGEEVEVTGQTTGSNVVTVVRGVNGSTKASQSNGTPVTLVGNSRLGNEIDQDAYRQTRSTVTRYLQRYQVPVQIGGGVMDLKNLELPYGDPLSQEREDKLFDMLTDIEYTLCYGTGTTTAHVAAGERRRQAGLKTQIATNKVTAPSDAAAYTFDSFFRDVIQGPLNNNGSPDLVLVSPGWASAFNKWGWAKAAVSSPTNLTELGVPIEGMVVPLAGRNITFVMCPKLGSSTNHTAVGLTSANVRLRELHEETYHPRGRRGDAVEGDWIADLGLEVQNEHQCSWTEGVTGFA